MPITSPDNLWSPDPTDPYNLTLHLAQMQTSVQTALNTKQNALTELGPDILPLAAGWGGAVSIVRLGRFVSMRGYLSLSSGIITSGAMPLASAIPTAYRPTNTSGFSLISGNGQSTCQIHIGQDGIVRLHPGIGTTSSAIPSCTWTV